MSEAEPDDPSSEEPIVEAEVIEAEVVDTEAGEPVTDDDPAEGGETLTVEQLIDDLGAVAAERDSYLADSQRIAAEFANFRRQVEKRNAELIAQAAGSLVERLLPVLDACDGAIAHGSDDVEPIRSAFFDVLTKEGLELVTPDVGDDFDPNRHEAVSHVADDSEDRPGPAVDSMMRAGYLWNGRVLRAAMVTVRG